MGGPVLYLKSMSATTIKLEADLVRKVVALKAQNESVSAFVRELIEREHRARANRDAALAYRQFLNNQPEERAAMEAWESAPLVAEIEGGKP
jgi:predicted CopG family antitoxin